MLFRSLADGRSFTSIALNEAAIKRNEKTMAADVCLNDVLFESFRGLVKKKMGWRILYSLVHGVRWNKVCRMFTA